MRFRIAKKILFRRHSSWSRKLRKLRPPYVNEKGNTVYPSLHDIAQVAKAREVYLNHIKRNKKKFLP